MEAGCSASRLGPGTCLLSRWTKVGAQKWRSKDWPGSTLDPGCSWGTRTSSCPFYGSEFSSHAQVHPR